MFRSYVRINYRNPTGNHGTRVIPAPNSHALFKYYTTRSTLTITPLGLLVIFIIIDPYFYLILCIIPFRPFGFILFASLSVTTTSLRGGGGGGGYVTLRIARTHVVPVVGAVASAVMVVVGGGGRRVVRRVRCVIHMG